MCECGLKTILWVWKNILVFKNVSVLWGFQIFIDSCLHNMVNNFHKIVIAVSVDFAKSCLLYTLNSIQPWL